MEISWYEKRYVNIPHQRVEAEFLYQNKYQESWSPYRYSKTDCIKIRRDLYHPIYIMSLKGIGLLYQGLRVPLQQYSPDLELIDGWGSNPMIQVEPYDKVSIKIQCSMPTIHLYDGRHLYTHSNWIILETFDVERIVFFCTVQKKLFEDSISLLDDTIFLGRP